MAVTPRSLEMGLNPIMAGFSTIIFLSLILSTGILATILSCAVFGNWLPLFSSLAYLLAPLPNLIFGSLAGNNDSIFGNENTGLVEIGYFMTSFLLVFGAGIPLILLHSGKIVFASALLSIIGGALVYVTIVGYLFYFSNQTDQNGF